MHFVHFSSRTVMCQNWHPHDCPPLLRFCDREGMKQEKNSVRAFYLIKQKFIESDPDRKRTSRKEKADSGKKVLSGERIPNRETGSRDRPRTRRAAPLHAHPTRRKNGYTVQVWLRPPLTPIFTEASLKDFLRSSLRIS